MGTSMYYHGEVRLRCRNRAARDSRIAAVAVAVPVRDEAERILPCVDALDALRDEQDRRYPPPALHIVLLLNSCTDGSGEQIERHLSRWRAAVSVYEATLPPALQNAGQARRLANLQALECVDAEHGLLFMTDADSCVPADWVARYAKLLRSSCDAVAGTVDVSSRDRFELPLPLAGRCALEHRYAQLLDRLECQLDPLPHDPWPRHYGAYGANLAMRADAMHVIGDFPTDASGEDRALVKLLERHGLRVRHDAQTRVTTSGRIVGRAAGGWAETMRHRLLEPELACDARIERAECAQRRALLRARCRHLHESRGGDRESATLAGDLGISCAALADAMAAEAFGAAWQRLESYAPALLHTPMYPSQLKDEIACALALLEMDVAVRNECAEGAPEAAEAASASGRNRVAA